ncbi:MAG: DUF92 domain-containing protein [Thermoplasmata archaeon]|nr:DUF92 domain-containing protein [Thermoplasmata archaeon]
MLQLLYAATGVVVTGLLAGGAVASGALTRPAGVVAALFGVVIVLVAGFAYLALLVLFVVASVLATRYRFDVKATAHVQEGVHGERGVSNVLAHILVPCGLVLLAHFGPWQFHGAILAPLYASALSFGAADTFASEFGVLAGNARSIISGGPVTAGTNGGVSAVGEAWAVVGALTTAVVGLVLLRSLGSPYGSATLFLFTVAIAGFLGCQVDSVLGETLENRGVLTKGGTNLLSMVATVGIAAVLLALGGGYR